MVRGSLVFSSYYGSVHVTGSRACLPRYLDVLQGFGPGPPKVAEGSFFGWGWICGLEGSLTLAFLVLEPSSQGAQSTLLRLSVHIRDQGRPFGDQREHLHLGRARLGYKVAADPVAIMGREP